MASETIVALLLGGTFLLGCAVACARLLFRPPRDPNVYVLDVTEEDGMTTVRFLADGEERAVRVPSQPLIERSYPSTPERTRGPDA
jgi:hypothetical protein